MTCNRMMIMYEGKILASDTPDNLQQMAAGNNNVIAEIAASREELLTCWQEMPEVLRFEINPASGNGFHRCSLTAQNGVDLRPQVFERAKSRGWQLRELTRNRSSLEDIYVQLTRPEEEDN
jgi:ABC-2 type transport system ATP-binding protein